MPSLNHFLATTELTAKLFIIEDKSQKFSLLHQAQTDKLTEEVRMFSYITSFPKSILLYALSNSTTTSVV